MSEFLQGLLSSLFSFHTPCAVSYLDKHTVIFLYEGAQVKSQAHMSEISQEGGGAAPCIL